MAEPPVLPGAVQLTTADRAATVADTFVGWVAADADEIDAEVAVPVSYPTLVVVTVTVDAVPDGIPVTVIKPVELFIEVGLPNELVTDHAVTVS